MYSSVQYVISFLDVPQVLERIIFGCLIGYCEYKYQMIPVKPLKQYLALRSREVVAPIVFFFLIKKNKFIYFLAVLGLRCCARAFSSCSKWGLLFIAVHGLLIVVASFVVEHRLQAHRLQQLWRGGSVVVARGLSSCGLQALECRLSSCGAWA